MKHYQVIVVGGGFSGAMAAFAAGREGLSTLLVEKSGTLGGAACLNYVLPFMRYHMKKEDGSRVMLNRGLFAEFLQRMEHYGEEEGTDTVFRFGHTYNEEYLKLTLDDMAEQYGVDVLFHSTLVDAQTEGERVTAIRVANVEGLQTLTADYFVDATGDALLSMLSGCACRVGREADQKCQPMTLCFRMGNVDVDRFYREDAKAVNELWAQKLAAGELSNPRENILTFHHSTHDVLHLNTTRVLLSPVDAMERSRAERIARRQMLEVYRFLRQYAPSCKDATLLSSASEIGVRESRMVEGLYTFTGADIVACRKFEDGIAAGNYDIDIHSPDGSGTSHYWIPEGEFYTVPYRSLIPRGKGNLLVVGRCISSDHEAQASYRIMPIVSCIGEGAGIALGIAARANSATYDVPVDALRRELDRRDLVERV